MTEKNERDEVNRVGVLICRAGGSLLLWVLGGFFAARAMAGDNESARQKAALLCAACHGEAGNSTVPAHPILAGQINETLYTQLNDFREDNGRPAARKNEEMRRINQVLSDTDRRALALYFSRQPWNSSAPPESMDKKNQDAGRFSAGSLLWRRGDFEKGVPACSGCHGPAGRGLPTHIPRLAGQHRAYIETQLENYRGQERASDRNEVMRGISKPLSDTQIKALSDHIAWALRSPGGS